MIKRGGFDVYFWESFEDRKKDKQSNANTYRKVVHGQYSRKGNKCSSGSITLPENSIHEFTFTIPMGNSLYQKMEPFKSIIEVVNLHDNEVEFSDVCFRLLIK